MSTRRWYGLLLVFVLSAALLVGCGGDDDDSNPAGPGDGGNQGDLNLDDLDDGQVEDVVTNPGTGLNASAQTTMATAGGLKAQMNGGAVGPMSVRIDDELNELPTLADAPEGWTGPDGNGWYTYDGDMYDYGTMRMRMTPDRWDPDYDGSPLTRVEYELANVFEQGPATIDYTWYYWAETDADRTVMDGAYEWDVTSTTSAGGQEVSYDYGWDLSWQNVSLESGNYSGTFMSNSLIPVQTNTGMQMVAASTNLSLNADGTGSGTGEIAGVEYVRYTFEGVSGDSITGFYTLMGEDWEIEHPFSWFVIR